MSAEIEVPAIGIDLGTTNSCVAIYLNDRAEIIANDVGERTTPSYVGFKEEETLVGKIAKDQAHRNYRNTIFDVKRIIGKRFRDHDVQKYIKHWPFFVVENRGNPVFKIRQDNEDVLYCPEQISAIVLEKLKQVASKRTETPVTKAVITVPAYFNDSQRQATKDAGKLAGLDVVRLLNEPTAAAIAYALDKTGNNNSKVVLVFDLGGGTFDVSIIKFENRHVTVIAIDGDSHLGGDDFDHNLFEYLADDILNRFSFDVKDNRRAMARLLSACERTKRLLSFQAAAQIELDGLVDGEDYDLNVSRAKFEDLNEDLFQRTIMVIKSCMSSAQLSPEDIDDVVLVGGSTRIPRVKELLEEYFSGKYLSNSLNPDEAVAIGAAIQAAYLGSHKSQVVEDFVLQDVLPFSLGVETAGGIMSFLIRRNSPLPANAMKSYTTASDNQDSVTIKIFEGEQLSTQDNHFLGQLKVTGIASAPSGVPRIDEQFYVDENGILSVTAVERSSKIVANLDIELDKGRLSSDELTRIIQRASKNRKHDEKHWRLLSAKNELESYCNKLLRKLVNLEMPFDRRNFIFVECDKALASIKETQNETDLRDKLKQLKESCESIMETYTT